jgi:hypothetical protein
MTAGTARIVLEGGKLRWSSPKLFNDPFDVQFDLHVQYDRRRVAQRAMQAIVGGYQGRAEINPRNILGRILLLLRDRAPGMSEAELRTKLEPGLYEGMERAERRIPRTHEEFREVVVDLKLLCLSEVHDNILMWAHYGRDHTGVVLELSCIEELDSAWGAAKPVRYQERMPLLIDEDQLVALMSGVGTLVDPQVFENSVYVKAADWAYEKEWRMVGGRDKRKESEDFGFHSNEMTAVYMGCRIAKEDAEAIRKVISVTYPHARIFVGSKSDRRFAVEFAELK